MSLLEHSCPCDSTTFWHAKMWLVSSTFPDANIDARDHGGKKPIHMLNPKASERTRSRWWRRPSHGLERARSLINSWMYALLPTQFYCQDSTPTVCPWEVEQSPSLTPRLFPASRHKKSWGVRLVNHFVTSSNFNIFVFSVYDSWRSWAPTNVQSAF